jgi:hypothetical protein
MVCSVVDASSAIQSVRQGKIGTPKRLQIRLISSPAKKAAMVNSHCSTGPMVIAGRLLVLFVLSKRKAQLVLGTLVCKAIIE